MNKLFDSKYPIVEASMNGGSSLDLAVAVHQAGAFPSLFLSRLNYEETKETLEKFKEITNSTNVVIPMGRPELLDRDFIKLIHNFGPSHIELFPSDAQGNVDNPESYFSEPLIVPALKFLKQKSKLILRLYRPVDTNIAQHVDGFYVKGQESAGKTGSWSVKDLFVEQKNRTPKTPVIPYGGVGTPEHVHWYISNGAEAVGVGTVFAACKESPLSLEVKQKIIKTTSRDITNLDDTKQNSLVLDKVPAIDKDWNRSADLYKTLKGDGTSGHLYLGHAVDHINKIRTVQETVQYLCSSL